MSEPKVVATIVTRNRKDLLRDSLEALFAQTRPVQETIVVDNASDDGTATMLAEEFPDVKVVAFTENQGAAGGFCEAIAAALRADFDWLWLLDDDSVARPDALAQLFSALDQLDGRAALLCSRVEWIDGTPHAMNRPVMPQQRDWRVVDAITDGVLPVRAATYVSLLLSRAGVDGAGLPPRHFFWQTDDIEYTARILRDAPGYYVARSIVEHRTPEQYTAVHDHRRFWFHIRNTLLMIRGQAWRPREKPRLFKTIVVTSIHYLRRNRLSPRSVRNLVSALIAGVRRV